MNRKEDQLNLSSSRESVNVFQIGDTQLSFRPVHYQFLIEVYLIDVYRSHLLTKGDVVLDLGAGIGDFSVLASKKVGPSGKVIAIEPDRDDYALLQENILKNNCNNTIALNIGVGNEEGNRTLSFRGRNYAFRVNTLHNIMQSLNFSDKIDFVKMDIEGFEREAISSGLDLLSDARAISIELHNTRQDVDNLLTPCGYTFIPLSKIHIYKRVIRNMILHPLLLYDAYRTIKQHNPHLLSFVTHGLDYDTNSAYLTGTYVKGKNKLHR